MLWLDVGLFFFHFFHYGGYAMGSFNLETHVLQLFALLSYLDSFCSHVGPPGLVFYFANPFHLFTFSF